ncbi:hypothetical protein HDU87_007502 [Geranomyces variabilis]|uniref:Uncharacterized protein n=1 Tax=Geranomyces variabilis TaxID=109894 RepID=A0AAD5XSV4_9FUNG|nr:hypothetical protein HDU87_007502 [Geranomyces variabilis]
MYSESEIPVEIAPQNLEASAAFNDTFQQIKTSWQETQYKFYSPEGAYLARRVIDSIYAGGAKALEAANEVKLNVHRDHAVPSLSKRLQAYGFKKEVGAASPSTATPPPSVITTPGGYVAPSTISPGQSAPAAPQWMLKNRAPGLQQAAYGTRRTSGVSVSVKKGLERDVHVNQMSVNEVIELENRARLQKQQEEDEKRRIKEAADQEKEEKLRARRQAAEEKKAAAERRKNEVAKKRADAIAAKEEESRRAKEQKEKADKEKKEQDEARAKAEKEKRDKERAMILEASKLENEAAEEKQAEQDHMQGVEQAGVQSKLKRTKSPALEDDIPAKKKRASRNSQSDVKPDDNEASAPDAKKRRVSSAQSTSAKSAATPAPAKPSNVKPPPSYEELLGDATLPAREEGILRAFLNGDFEGCHGEHVISLSDTPVDGGRRHVVIKFDYDTGMVAKVAKVTRTKKKKLTPTSVSHL